MSWFERMVERHILKAKAQGQLDNLEGEGKPLPKRPGDEIVDPGLAAGYRIMAEAGVLPPEIELKKKVDAHKAHLATLTDPDARKAAMAELSQAELRFAIAREARQKFHRG